MLKKISPNKAVSDHLPLVAKFEGVLTMNDLWPDFDMIEQTEANNALKILREQSRALAKKMGNKVKATFSKIQYTETLSGLTSALSVVATLNAAKVKREEVLEEDLTGKTNISDVLKEQYYKFEIYNEKYRFRLFTYTYTPIYPNKMLLDENIAKEIDEKQEVSVENDQEIIDLLRSIFSSQRVARIIRMMVLEMEGDDKKTN